MASTKSLITVRLGKMDFTVYVEWSYIPGEPEVRYYPDGSGYPGSDPEFDCINYIRCEECEYPTDGPGYYEDTDTGVSYEYAARADRRDAFVIAERWILADLEAGLYIDELFDNAECDDYAG